jgi:hypothetical protein
LGVTEVTAGDPASAVVGHYRTPLCGKRAQKGARQAPGALAGRQEFVSFPAIPGPAQTGSIGTPRLARILLLMHRKRK